MAGSLNTYFRRHALDRDAAADLVSGTFAEAADEQARGASVTEDRIWRLAERELRNFLLGGPRTQHTTARDTSPHERVADDDLFEFVAQSETKDELADAISALPERQKLVIALHDYEGLTVEEIGEVLGVRASQVEHLRGDAMRALAAKLDLERRGPAPQPVILGPDGAPLESASVSRRELEISVAEISD